MESDNKKGFWFFLSNFFDRTLLFFLSSTEKEQKTFGCLQPTCFVIFFLSFFQGLTTLFVSEEIFFLLGQVLPNWNFSRNFSNFIDGTKNFSLFGSSGLPPTKKEKTRKQKSKKKKNRLGTQLWSQDRKTQFFFFKRSLNVYFLMGSWYGRFPKKTLEKNFYWYWPGLVTTELGKI
jgi:hypothetical protein